MPFQLSPGVSVVEKDFTSIAPSVSSSAGATAGVFSWGPIEDPIRVSSENELVEIFGKPSDDTHSAFFTSANFLAYANNLLVSRSDATNLRNAVSNPSGGISTANVEILSAGSGYNSEDTITVAFGAPNLNGGIQATGTAVFVDSPADRTITDVSLTLAGSGYTSSDNIVVTISAPGAEGGVAATATAVFNDRTDRTIDGITNLDAGSGYTTSDTITVTFSAPSNPEGTVATADVDFTDVGGDRTINGITNINPGSGYTTSDTITITFSAPASGVTATADVTFVDSTVTIRTITDINLNTAGSGYTSADLVTATISAPSAGGTTATANVVFTDATVVDRTITGITVVNAGSGYTSAPSITISSPGAGGTTATAKVNTVVKQGMKIKNTFEYTQSFSGGANAHGPFAAKFAGSRGNKLRVVVLDSGSWGAASQSVKNQFAGAPGTSSYAQSKGISDDEVHVIIYDSPEGTFSSVGNSVLEKYSFLSKLSDAKRSDGSNNYYKNVLNTLSKYVWWTDNPLSSQVSNFAPTGLVTAGNVVFNSTNKTITVSSAGAFAQLALFTTFYNNAPDNSSRQIRITGTNNNDGVYTLSGSNGIVANVVADVVQGYTFTVSENLTSETSTATSISSVDKFSWGVSSSTVLAGDQSYRLSMLNDQADYQLSGGQDDFNSSEGQIQSAFALLANSEQYDVSLIAAGNVSAVTAKFIVDNVAEVRKDCVVFISPRDVTTGSPVLTTGSSATAALIAFRDSSQINSSYAMMDSGFKYQYDRYNDVYRWVPLNGDIAGLCARTDYTADPWFSPGGFTRGSIKNIVKLAFNPTQTDRDVLYLSGINPVVNFPGQGTVLFGDKTLLSRPSAFDRINVRRLFIVLEKSIALAARTQMFEFNDSFTRAQFKNLVEPFLRDVQGRRGITDFRVKCDESNNTGEVIDRNEFVADIFIKPNRSINFINLTFVAARSSVSFEEIGA